MKTITKLNRLLLVAVIVLISMNVSTVDAALLCGDANGNGKVDLLDISCIIDALYRGGPAPVSWDMVDVDNSGKCDLRDVAYLINYMYRKGLDLVCPGDAASGGLIDHGACKDFGNFSLAAAFSGNQDGIAYDYNGLGMLSLHHINAGLNCCPIFVSIVTIEGSDIIIEELDSLDQGGCHCLCLYDLDYRISNLPPGSYHIKVIEPFISVDMEQLEFDVDLSAATSGFYFVLRDEYPWMQF